MTGGKRPRPVLAAAARQTPLLAAGPVLIGPAYLAALTSAGVPIGRWDVVAAALLSLASTLLPLLAARNAVREAEDQVTPTGSPRDDAGRRLLPVDRQLDGLLREYLADRGADVRQAAPEPDRTTGTRAYPDLSRAESMVADGRTRQRTRPPGGGPASDPPLLAGAYRAADGPRSKQVHDDWTGQRATEHDEARARHRGRT